MLQSKTKVVVVPIQFQVSGSGVTIGQGACPTPTEIDGTRWTMMKNNGEKNSDVFYREIVFTSMIFFLVLGTR